MPERRDGSIAQLGEHLPYKQRVTGSSPVVSTMWGLVVQLVRTPACHAGGRRFEPVLGRHASVAQLVEQRTENPRVGGSIPPGGTTADVAHLVERHLAKVEVASSSLVIRSSKRRNGALCVILSLWCHSQVVRPRSAKPLFPGSNPGGTSNFPPQSFVL